MPPICGISLQILVLWNWSGAVFTPEDLFVCFIIVCIRVAIKVFSLFLHCYQITLIIPLSINYPFQHSFFINTSSQMGLHFRLLFVTVIVNFIMFFIPVLFYYLLLYSNLLCYVFVCMIFVFVGSMPEVISLLCTGAFWQKLII